MMQPQNAGIITTRDFPQKREREIKFYENRDDGGWQNWQCG